MAKIIVVTRNGVFEDILSEDPSIEVEVYEIHKLGELPKLKSEDTE